MGEAVEPQYWVRTEQGLVWGPYPRAVLGRLRGRLQGRCDVSTDGRSYRPSSDFPELAELLGGPAAPRAAPIITPPMGVAPVVQPPPPPREHEELRVPEEGELGVISAVRLYALSAATSATGWLQLTTPDGGLIQVSFRRGAPEHISSDDPELGILRFLVERRAISAEQAFRVEEHRAKAGTDAVSALFALQLVSPSDAHRVLGEHMGFLLDRALSTWRGSFTFEADAPAPPGAYPLGGKWGLLVESCRRMDAAVVRARLGRRLQRRAMRSGGGSIGRLEDLTLTAQEVRIYAGIDGTRTGDELLRSIPDAGVALRLLYLLAELGHVAFDDPAQAQAQRQAQQQRSTQPPPTPAARPPPQVTQRSQAPQAAAPPPRSGPVKTVRPPAVVAPPPSRPEPPRAPPAPSAGGDQLAALEQTLAELEKADHFTALGLTRKASAADAKRAFFQLAREYHPDTVSEGSPPQLRSLKERLFARVNEAAAVIGDEARRKEYEAGLDGHGAVDVGNIFAAEESFRRAEIIVKARRYAEGLELIEEAIKLHATEGEYYAWRGWTRFMLSKDRRVALPEAVAECKKALQLSPRCTPAWLFQGQMLKIVGDLKGAEACFKKVLTLDENNLDASRELRYLFPGKR